MAFPPEQTPNYCDLCGRSLVPLATPHVQRNCQDCGKTIHLAEPGEKGEGIKVEAGDRFVIPAGWLRLSLNPADGSGRFSRFGITWFVRNLLFDDRPKTPEDVSTTLDAYTRVADSVLENSPLLKNLDLETETGGQKAVEIVKEHGESPEFWAMFIGTMSLIVKEASDEKDVTRAIWAMNLLSNARAMLLFSQHLEEHVWRGYLANQVIYNVASAAAKDPAEAEAIKKLEPLFERQTESVLHSWVNDGRPIGPRIGVTALPEETLKALAGWHLSLFERRRQEERNVQEQRRYRQEAWNKGLGTGAAIATALAALIAGAIKALEFLGYFGNSTTAT